MLPRLHFSGLIALVSLMGASPLAAQGMMIPLVPLSGTTRPPQTGDPDGNIAQQSACIGRPAPPPSAFGASAGDSALLGEALANEVSCQLVPRGVADPSAVCVIVTAASVGGRFADAFDRALVTQVGDVPRAADNGLPIRSFHVTEVRAVGTNAEVFVSTGGGPADGNGRGWADDLMYVFAKQPSGAWQFDGRLALQMGNTQLNEARLSATRPRSC